MLTKWNEIFRCMDHFWWSSIEESIRQLESHLENWVLSPSEQRIKWVIWWQVMNLINQDYISVYWGEMSDKIHSMMKSIDLSIFGWDRFRTSLWIIIDSPYRANDNTSKPWTKHHIIDAKETPIQDRKITWIVVNISKFTPEQLQIVLKLWKKYNLPTYRAEKKFVDNDLVVELIELTTDTSASPEEPLCQQ